MTEEHSPEQDVRKKSRSKKRKERRRRRSQGRQQGAMEIQKQVLDDGDDGLPCSSRTTANLRRTDDVRFHGLNNRLHVVETRVEYVVAVLAGQREVSEDLMEEVQANSQEIGSLRGEVSQTESNVLRAIAVHAEKDSKENAVHARTAFWTLLAVMLTALITFGAYVVDKLSHAGII